MKWFNKKPVIQAPPTPLTLPPKQLMKLAERGVHMYPETFNLGDQIVQTFHDYAAGHTTENKRFAPAFTQGHVAHVNTDDHYTNTQLMGASGRLFRLGGGTYTDHRHFAAAAMRYTNISTPANLHLAGSMRPGNDTNVLHGDLNTLSHGLRHPALALPEDAQTIMHVRGAYPGSAMHDIKQAFVGQKFRTDRFMSTTTNPSRHFSGDWKIHFELPKGYNKGVWIAPVSYHPSEMEFLMDRHQSFVKHRSNTVDPTDDKVIVHLKPTGD